MPITRRGSNGGRRQSRRAPPRRWVRFSASRASVWEASGPRRNSKERSSGYTATADPGYRWAPLMVSEGRGAAEPPWGRSFRFERARDGGGTPGLDRSRPSASDFHLAGAGRIDNQFLRIMGVCKHTGVGRGPGDPFRCRVIGLDGNGRRILEQILPEIYALRVLPASEGRLAGPADRPAVRIHIDRGAIAEIDAGGTSGSLHQPERMRVLDRRCQLLADFLDLRIPGVSPEIEKLWNSACSRHANN